MPDYQAPLLLCQEPSVLPDQYWVILHHGHSLEQHKRAVGNGTDLDSAIQTFIQEHEEHESQGAFYFADLNNADLAAVRADIGVDFVECNMPIVSIMDVDPVYLTEESQHELDAQHAYMFAMDRETRLGYEASHHLQDGDIDFDDGYDLEVDTEHHLDAEIGVQS